MHWERNIINYYSCKHALFCTWDVHTDFLLSNDALSPWQQLDIIMSSAWLLSTHKFHDNSPITKQ